MKLSKLKQFLYTMISFAVLGAAFKVMVLVEGITEVRPANAIPMVSGLMFGAVGGIGCAVGNLIADLFGSLSLVSGIGMFANFIAAYLPWRLWYVYRNEKPNVHTFKNLFLYVYLSFVSALTVAWILSFGSELVLGEWIENIYKYIFLNNFCFSVGLGLPLFIVFTSDSIKLELTNSPKSLEDISSRKSNVLKIATLIFTIILIAIMALVFMGYHLSNSYIIIALNIITIIIFAFLCIYPINYKKKKP